MGRQVNFYMTVADERRFLDYVRSSGDIAIFVSVQSTVAIRELDELPTTGTPFWFSLCLWNKGECQPPRLTYVAQQRYYCVAEFESEVISFHRCEISEGHLVRGRIWAEISYWRLGDDPPSIATKSKAFQNWYGRLSGWIKRYGERDNNGDYVLPDAVEYACRGGRLVEGIPGQSRPR